MVNIKCKVCHKVQSINTNDANLYNLPVVIDNFVCYLCTQKIKLVKLNLTCNKCKSTFCTKVLGSNKLNYNNWTCPVCTSNDIKNVITKGKTSELNCPICFHGNGVCNHPELSCSSSSKFVKFSNSNLYSVKGSKECSILSINEIDKKRTDIHAFKYVPLHKTHYSLSFNNLILIRQRINSKNNFITNIILYNYKNKWQEVYNNKFEKGRNWVVDVLKFIVETNLLSC